MHNIKHSQSSVRVVSFDFDGVFVLDSEAVFKEEAWQKVFANYQGRYEQFLAEGQKQFGHGKSGGRKEIMHHVFTKLCESPANIEQLVTKSSETFNSHVQRRIQESGLVTGAMDMLAEISNRGLPLYLNSGTATSALVESTKNLKIDHFFSGILGSTEEPIGGSKVENLLYIAKREAVKPEHILTVGDGTSDVAAANKTGGRFLGIANRWNGWEKSNQLFPIVTKLVEVPNYL